MRKVSSHYLHLPDGTFLPQQVVEMSRGEVVNYYPLDGESEDIEWYPGVIELHPEEGGRCTAWLLYPYDFIGMKPVGGTQRRQLK